MPWVRIDENAMDHPKFLALNDGAWRLWCEAQAYCQKHLTDGRIPWAALKGFRYYSASRVATLLQSHVAGKSALWHKEPDGSIQVHDYHDWNDSSATVLHARKQAKARRDAFTQRQTERRSVVVPNAVPGAYETANVPSGVVCRSSTPVPKPNGTAYARTTNPSEFPPEVLARVAPFLEKYQDLYAKHQHGAHYLVHPHKDFPEAALLCQHFSDERLERMTVLWLTTDDPFASSGSRSLAQFRSKASWCDARLRERGL